LASKLFAEEGKKQGERGEPEVTKAGGTTGKKRFQI